MSTDRSRRRELADVYQQRPREAAVYLIRDTASSRRLLCSTVDLASVRNRMDFARTTGTASAVDGRLPTEMPGVRLADLEIEVLDTLEVTPAMTDREVRDDLATLESLWRERLAGEGAGEAGV